MRRFLVLAFFLSAAGGITLHGQSAVAADNSHHGKAQVGFHYENAQLQPAKYAFVIYEDGSGSYHSEPAATPPPDTPSYHPLAHAQDRTVQISKPLVEQIFATARQEKFFAIPCDDKKDKVAFQGTKELSYQGPEGQGSCTYNWSKSASIHKLTDIFEGIAFTLEEGRRLEVEQKHDRLAVDAELGDLLQAVKEGRALEIHNIQPTLQEIIDDESIIGRARTRAGKLLDEANSPGY
jgi:hypothetical protein